MKTDKEYSKLSREELKKLLREWKDQPEEEAVEVFINLLNVAMDAGFQSGYLTAIQKKNFVNH